MHAALVSASLPQSHLLHFIGNQLTETLGLQAQHAGEVYEQNLLLLRVLMQYNSYPLKGTVLEVPPAQHALAATSRSSQCQQERKG
eukprot:scaffold16486_cov20-Tisochrysis_lutea.AAC.3